MGTREGRIRAGLAVTLMAIGLGVILARDPRLHHWRLVAYIDADPTTHFITLQDFRSDRPLRSGGTTGRPLFIGGSLAFSLTEVRGAIACNAYAGGYRLNPFTQTLAIDGLEQTLMGCGGEAWSGTFLPQLSRATRYAYDGTTLRIYADADQTVLIFEKAPITFRLASLREHPWARWLLRWLDQ